MRAMADRIASISRYSNNHTFQDMRSQVLLMISRRFQLILLAAVWHPSRLFASQSLLDRILHAENVWPFGSSDTIGQFVWCFYLHRHECETPQNETKKYLAVLIWKLIRVRCWQKLIIFSQYLLRTEIDLGFQASMHQRQTVLNTALMCRCTLNIQQLCSRRKRNFQYIC